MNSLGCGIMMVVVSLVMSCSPREELQDGDIVFQNCQSRQAPAIALATQSKYTHVGLVLHENGEAYVYEAVQPVRKVSLKQWISRGKDNHYVAKRLKHTEKLDATALRKVVQPMLGKNYDARFEWSDQRVYCSELVWKAFQRGLDIKLCALRRLGDFELGSPVVKKILQERYGRNIPLQMQIVAPSDLFNSRLLTTIR